MKTNTRFQGIFGYDHQTHTVLVKVGGKFYRRKLIKDLAGYFIQVNNRLYEIKGKVKYYQKKEK